MEYRKPHSRNAKTINKRKGYLRRYNAASICYWSQALASLGDKNEKSCLRVSSPFILTGGAAATGGLVPFSVKIWSLPMNCSWLSFSSNCSPRWLADFKERI